MTPTFGSSPRTTPHAPARRESVTSILIAASAGTGKTYRLAQRFIALMALGAPPLSMIALTFTRKAAGEFLERILCRLAEGAASDEGAEKLADSVRDCWYGNPEEGLVPLCKEADESLHPLTRARFRELLLEFIEDLDKQHLTTIDSFFYRIVALSGLELGLQELSMGNMSQLQRVRREAGREMLADISSNIELQELNALLLDAGLTGRQPLHDELDALISDYGHICEQADRPELWTAWQNAFDMPDFSRCPELDWEYYEQAKAELLEHAAHIERSADIRDGVTELALQALAAIRKSVATKIDKVLKPVDKDKKAPLGDDPAVCRILGILERVRRDRINCFIGACQRRTLSVYRLLSLYRRYYLRLARRQACFSFNDVTRMVPAALGSDAAPSQLAYRLDGELNHWMLDEFQDTAQEQWECLSRLLDEILTETGGNDEHRAERSLFVVGDIKQAIYGWRGADDLSFRRLRAADSPLCRMSMAKSYRSSAVVLDFVNRIFGFNDEATRHTAARRLSGYVRVSRFGNPRGKQTLIDDPGTYIDAVESILAELPLKQKRMSVCILLRSNEKVRELTDALHRRCPELPVRSLSDIKAASSSPLGHALLHFFRWLRHPSDPFHRNMLRCSPLGPLLEGVGGDWQSWRRRFEQQGCAAVTERIRQWLENARRNGRPLLTDYLRRSMQIWTEQALAFDATGGDLAAWLDHMESLTLKENPPKNCIHVMTMHKSKGLEYDVVILPLTTPKNSGPKVLTLRDGQGGISGVFLPPPNKDQRELISALSTALAADAETKAAETRNLLYVALTRAARALYIPIARNSIIAGSMSQIINEALAEDMSAAAVRVAYESGDRRWYDELDELAAAAAEPPAAAPLPPPDTRRRRVSPSSLSGADEEAAYAEEGRESGETWESGKADDLAQQAELSIGQAERRAEALAFGTAVHALLESVEWLDEQNPPAWYLSPATAAEKLVSQALRDPALRAFFTRRDGVEVCNEQALEAVTESEWTSAVIDRLMLYPAEGRAEILDYKTTRSHDDLSEHYRPQMQAYRRLSSRAIGLSEASIGVTLVQLNLDGSVHLHRYGDDELR